MILVDANLLLYAHDASSAQHATARRWLENVLSGAEPVGLAWAAMLAFLRVGTNPRLHLEAPTLEEAIAIVASWFERPNVALLNPG